MYIRQILYNSRRRGADTLIFLKECLHRLHGRLTKGYSDAIDATAALIAICAMLQVGSCLCDYNMTLLDLQKAAEVSARSAAICTNLRDAREQAVRVLEAAVRNRNLKNLGLEMQYLDGDGTWRKQTTLLVTASATIANPLAGEKKHSVRTLVTIEADLYKEDGYKGMHYKNKGIKGTTNFSDLDFEVCAGLLRSLEQFGGDFNRATDPSQMESKYGFVAPPHANGSSAEKTVTVGIGCWCNGTVTTLFKNIWETMPSSEWKQYDPSGTVSAHARSGNWIEYYPSASVKRSMSQILSSETGKECQRSLMFSMIEDIAAECQKNYTTDKAATMMFVEISWLGGVNSGHRIFKKLGGNYSLQNILYTLDLDKQSPNPLLVGSSLWGSRHICAVNILQKYITGTLPLANLMAQLDGIT